MLRFSGLLCLALLLCGAQSRPKKPVFAAIYKVAATHFAAGRYDEAAQGFISLLESYPGNEAARVQLAKAYVKLERPTDAFQVFQSLNPSGFDADTSYEYAQAYYSQRQWEGALFGFKRVPDGHPLYDMAGYYGAIAALNLRHYAEAQELIENAVVLPTRLVRSRETYRRTIQDLKNREEKELLSRQRTADIAFMRQQTRQINRQIREQSAQIPEIQATSAPSPPNNEPDLGLIQRSSYAGASSDVLLQTRDYRQTRDETAQSRSLGATIMLAGEHQLYPKRLASPGFGAAISVQGEARTFSGQESPSGSIERVTKGQMFKDGSGVDKIIGSTAQIWAEAPLVNNWGWIGAEAEYYQAFLVGERDKPSLTGAWVFAGRNSKSLNLRSKAGYFSMRQPDGRIGSQWTEQQIECAFMTTLGLGLSTSVGANQYSYPRPEVDGPANTVNAEIRTSLDLPLQTQIGIAGSFSYARDIQATNLGIIDLLIFDEGSFGGRAYINWNPLSWLTIEVDGNMTRRMFQRFSAKGEDVAIALEAKRPTFSTQTRLNAVLAYTF